ncbi:MAG: glycosyltransferase family 2 protein [Candidatus Sericytochromatia bacterium]
MVEKKQFDISIVIPLYNESKIFPYLIERLNSLSNITDLSIEFVLINDGSKDNTAQLMSSLALSDDRYNCVFLSRNYGHQTALTAGLKCARGTDAIMIIDGDLQDPPELLVDFYKYYKQGYDVVFAVRKKRKENFIKRFCYFIFYRILKKISYIDIPLDSGDFSLISRRALDVLNKMPEESRFIRGMRTWIGFKQIGIEYERSERFAGESKYTFRMLLKLAYNGIFNFSEFPIKFITNLGAFTVCLSLLYLTVTIFKKFVYGTVPEGFTALLFTIILFSGVQMVSLGVIGEYVLRIFFQVKERPLYIIENQVMDKEYLNG